eukprot:TRINITY_DN5726_c0_g1_i1.p2 TRINITY_DN5726_c0_g1~~TRINITY_DN5726_c0_g1_i1.p2  ORF type:complete len:120 (-),score=41.70 TRINITY_DN5726_c0_g1_i1:51-410(-)
MDIDITNIKPRLRKKPARYEDGYEEEEEDEKEDEKEEEEQEDEDDNDDDEVTVKKSPKGKKAKPSLKKRRMSNVEDFNKDLLSLMFGKKIVSPTRKRGRSSDSDESGSDVEKRIRRLVV